MRTTVKTIIAAALIAGGPAVFAATQGDDPKPASEGNMGHMMQGQDGKSHGMGMMGDGNMPMMKMMGQMNDMMETCNKMMQSKMENMNGPDGSTDKG